jgi:hypothetical protein
MGNTNILIAGDSHPLKALNAKLFYSAENVSQPAEPLVVTYWKLKYMLQRIKVDTLLIGFSYHNFSAFNDIKFKDDHYAVEMFKRIYAIQNFKEIENLPIDYVKFYKIYFQNMCLYPKRDHFNFYPIGNHFNIGDTTDKAKSFKADSETAINRHYFYNKKEAGVSETSIAFLDSLIDISRKKKITLILVGTPLHESYYNKIPNYIMNKYNYKKAGLIKEGIYIIDFTHQFSDDKYYLNSDHLNAKGATKFTKEIIDVLKTKSNSENKQKGVGLKL